MKGERGIFLLNQKEINGIMKIELIDQVKLMFVELLDRSLGPLREGTGTAKAVTGGVYFRQSKAFFDTTLPPSPPFGGATSLREGGKALFITAR